MRTLLGLLLSLGLLVSWLPSAAAQEVGASYASGTGTPAVYTDAEGNAVASLTVTDVDEDFQGYDDSYEPEHGYSYRAIEFTVENVSEDAIIVEPSRFSLIDAFGVTHSGSGIRLGNDSTDSYRDRFALSPGESASPLLVFQVPAHVAVAMFTWQPDSSVMVMVNIAADPSAASAVVHGMSTPANVTDDFGNVISTVQITGINDDWTDYSEYDAPDPGETYRAVHIRVTNETDRPVRVDPYEYALVGTNGMIYDSSYVTAADDAEQEVLRDMIELAPGESVDSMVVILMEDDQEPLALIKQDYSGSLAIVVIAEGSPAGDTGTATPDAEATPAGD